MYSMRFLIGVFLLLALASPFKSQGEELPSWELGLRGGTDSSRVDENYTAVEIYLLHDLPWQWSFSDNFQINTRLDASGTYLEAASEEGAMLGIGGDLVLCFHEFFELEGGFRPTWMTNYTFGKDDFGGGMQFTSHIGAATHWNGFVINYRYQHTSNAGIYSSNDGLNLHFAGLGYRF